MLINKLKDTRDKYKITQLDLADAVLTTRQTIHAIEKGKSVPSLELALKISGYFDLKVEDIFELENKMEAFHDTDLFSVF